MTRFFASLMFVSCLSPVAGAQDIINYAEHIKPIFAQSCSNCHNPDRARGGLDLMSYSGAISGGSAGKIVNTMDADGSSLLAVISHTAQPVMPPEGGKIADEKIELVRRWIEQGLRETSNSAAAAPSRPAVDLSVGTPMVGRPAGPPVMPWDMPLGPIHHTPRAGAVSELAGHPWSPIVAVAGQKQVLVYHTESHELLGVVPFALGQPEVIKFPGAGRLMLVAGGVAGMSGGVVLHDVETGDAVARVGEEMDSVLAADLDATQRFVALGGPAKLVKVYDLASGEIVHRIDKHTEWITALGFSPDGILLATADRNGGLYIWEAESGQPFYALDGHGQAITDLAWRYDGDVLATCSEDGNVRLWEMHKGVQVKSWSAHNGGTQSVAFAEDGRLVTTGRDRSVKIWDANGKLLIEAKHHKDISLAASFDTTGKHVFAGALDGKLIAWSLEDDAKQVSELSANPPTVELALQQIQAQHSESKKQVTQEQADVDAKRATSVKAAEAHAEARTVLEDLKQSIAELDQRVPQLEQSKNQSQSARDQAQAEFNEARAALEQTKQATQTAQNESTRLTGEHEKSAEEVASLTQQLEEVRKQAAEAEAKAKEQPENEDLQKQSAQLAEEVVKTQEQLTAKTAELEQRSAASDTAQQQLQAMLAQQAEAATVLDKKNEQLQAKIAELQDALAAIKQARENLDASKKAVAPAEQALEQAKQREEKLAEELADAVSQAASASEAAEQLQREQDKWQAARVRVQRDAVAAEMARVKAAEHPLQVKAQELATLRGGIATGLAEAKQRLADAPQARAEQRARIESMKKKLAEAKQGGDELDIEDAQFDLESAEYGMEKLEEQRAALPKQITKLEAELQQADRELAAAEQKVAEASAQLPALQQQYDAHDQSYRQLREAAGFAKPVK